MNQNSTFTVNYRQSKKGIYFPLYRIILESEVSENTPRSQTSIYSNKCMMYNCKCTNMALNFVY